MHRMLKMQMRVFADAQCHEKEVHHGEIAEQLQDAVLQQDPGEIHVVGNHHLTMVINQYRTQGSQ